MRKPNKKKINAARIRQSQTYSRHEISKKLGIHKNTITHWVKVGLAPLDNRKPELFHGSELKRFIKARRQKRKNICADNEMFCLKCRMPRTAKDKSVSIFKPNEKTANLVGECTVCGTTINRRISIGKLAIFEKSFGIETRQSSHLIEPQYSRLDCANKLPGAKQPDLFEI